MAKHKKRAWNNSNPLYRYLHSRGKKSHSTRRGHKSMARRHKKSYSRSTHFNVWASIIGVGLFIAYEAFVSPMLPFADPAKSIVELMVGLAFARKKGWMGNTARAAVIINAYQLMSIYLAPMLSR